MSIRQPSIPCSQAIRALDGGDALEQHSRLLAFLGDLLRVASDAPPAERSKGKEPGAVLAARSYLKAHLTRPVTLPELARAADLSPDHLIEVFRATTGVPPHRYQTLARLDLAKALLRRGHSAARVAIEVGFHDQSHLTRHFKRYFGYTPGWYQRHA